MMFSRSFTVHAGFASLYRIQAWALEQVVFAASPSGDLRFTFTALALKALAALDAVVERQLLRLARHNMRRALRGARLVASLGTADTMVAVGGR